MNFASLTGYPSHTCERDYWSDAEDLGITLMKNDMSRNRFQKLKSHLYFVDNGTVRQHAQDPSYKYQMIKFIDFCEVWFLPESVARVAAIVGDHHCHTHRH
ncbi:zinc finger protein [Trichonephila clavipes]|nr:zinc finger protein [Trichonephila clavipes]